jgi:hypothetical protein
MTGWLPHIAGIFQTQGQERGGLSMSQTKVASFLHNQWEVVTTRGTCSHIGPAWAITPLFSYLYDAN